MSVHLLDAASRGVLTLLLVLACATDLRSRRIPNPLVLAVFGAALAHAVLVHTMLDAVLGAFCGLALWLPLYAVRAFGAGDVKLFAAAAAWIGPAAVPGATLYAALAGGILGLVWFGARQFTQLAPTLMPRAFDEVLHTVPHATQSAACSGTPATMSRMTRVPYGLAIAAGVLCVVWSTP